MKLRFRKNSLRLRVNRREVESLAAGQTIEEQIYFPGDALISYVLETVPTGPATASFRQGVIRVAAPREEIQNWAHGDAIGLYFDLPASGAALKVAVEKDLECVDGPPEEREPYAFPRSTGKNC
ncbi:MAG TPA: hypothetical protein VFB14_09310 [Bryobacteraceae bacterium]|jgi:hypothetical protein|nr:hypothetical protein [Bryobacteraceae bacterium]